MFERTDDQGLFEETTHRFLASNSPLTKVRDLARSQSGFELDYWRQGGRYGAEMLQDCVQLHGGIGVTFDHDLHLFLRRVTSNIPAYGSIHEHALRITRQMETRQHSAREVRS
jgi:hypothetical protein